MDEAYFIPNILYNSHPNHIYGDHVAVSNKNHQTLKILERLYLYGGVYISDQYVPVKKLPAKHGVSINICHKHTGEISDSVLVSPKGSIFIRDLISWHQHNPNKQLASGIVELVSSGRYSYHDLGLIDNWDDCSYLFTEHSYLRPLLPENRSLKQYLYCYTKIDSTSFTYGLIIVILLVIIVAVFIYFWL